MAITAGLVGWASPTFQFTRYSIWWALPTLLLDKHPGKTFIGRIERGFDFLGYHFSREGLTVATKTVEQFVARATQRYAQEPGTPEGCRQAPGLCAAMDRRGGGRVDRATAAGVVWVGYRRFRQAAQPIIPSSPVPNSVIVAGSGIGATRASLMP